MLDRRIDYADIDNRTLFLRRDGVVVGPLTRRSMAVKDCWAYELNGMECLVRTDGSHYYGSSNYDLISRIPEPNMQSQAVKRAYIEVKPQEASFCDLNRKSFVAVRFGANLVEIKRVDGPSDYPVLKTSAAQLKEIAEFAEHGN
jgi:hypothetical protein